MPNLQDIKPAVEFAELNNSEGWEQVPGGAAGVQQKMLSGLLD